MPSWTNATAEAGTRGVLRPTATQQVAGLRRDMAVSTGLLPFVERYWAVRWDRTGQTPFRSEVLSHPSVNVSLEAGEHPRFGADLPAVLVHGVVRRRFVVDLVGRGRVVAAKFRPGGFTAMTGEQVRPDTVAVLSERLLPGLVPLLPGLDDATDDEVAARLDAALLSAAVEPTADYLALLDVLERMQVDRSLVRVDQVAVLAGVTPRSLQRLFARYVGRGPKAVLARYRLQDAVATMDATVGDDPDAVDLAGLAASLGWFDQAHFCRDFRDVVGVTPTAYLASGASVSR